jgi:micrococcal nuclease
MCFKNLCKYLFGCIRKKSVENDSTEKEPEYRKLEDVKYEDTVPYIPTIHKGKVIKVYDGDTITIASRLCIDDIESTQYYRFSVRIKGIDTPELKTKNETEKKRAIIARDALSSKISNKIVELKNVELEKYGRVLADVYIDGVNIGEWMLQEKHAVAYDGKTKNIPKEWVVTDTK